MPTLNNLDSKNSEVTDCPNKEDSQKDTKETSQELIKDLNINVKKGSNSVKEQKVQIFQNTKVVHHHHHYVTHIHHHHHHAEPNASEEVFMTKVGG